jgi:hypothetical protein
MDDCTALSPLPALGKCIRGQISSGTTSSFAGIVNIFYSGLLEGAKETQMILVKLSTL